MQDFLAQLLSNHPIAAPIIFILVRSLSIIIPPIPGAAMDLAAIPLFGWLWGFLYAQVGIMLGVTVAFWIARIFREPAVKRIATLQKIHEWEAKLSKRKEFLLLLALRLPTGFFDYLSWVAGLTKVSFISFFFATLIGELPPIFLFYYFGGLAFQKGIYYVIAFIVAIIVLAFVVGKERFLKEVYKLVKKYL
ncbi:MAG: TVP38/TMEM64 family protein [Candidatus Portnoybacteria bacterium]|nr:TVP38/TMEM64 family protein [Candidatus Portnoybacteria bacterium]